MKYVKLTYEEKLVGLTALTKLIEQNKECRIKSMKEWKAIITDYIRTERLFAYMETDGNEVEDRFTTSCANQMFHSLLTDGVFVMNSNKSTKTKAKFWRKFDNDLFLKIKSKQEVLINYLDDATPVSPPPLTFKDGDFVESVPVDVPEEIITLEVPAITPPKFVADEESNKAEIKAYINDIFGECFIPAKVFRAKHYNNNKPKDSQ